MCGLVTATTAAAATTATAAVTTATTTAAAATAAVTTATAAATAAGTFFTRTSHVYREGATVDFFAVQRLDGLLGLVRGAHRDKTKPTRTARGAIHHQVGFEDRTMRGERVLEVVFCGVEGKIPYKQFITHMMFDCQDKRCTCQTVPECRVSNHH
jgi:hypothetical protein